MTTEGYGADIPPELARAAHAGTSFDPERRGDQERAEYAATLERDLTNLMRLATTPEKRNTLAAEFERYRGGLRARWLKTLSARSRCLSTMIAGPSNFPARRMQKRSDVADRRWTELSEFRERALAAIRKALTPELAPIMSGDADAVERLRAKIAKEEELHALMVRVNAAHKEFLKDPATLEASDLADSLKARIRAYVPAYSWEPHPFAPFELTNSGANIRRLKARLELVARAKAEPGSAAEGSAARVEDCPADNRVRVFFPGKPGEDVRSTLKGGGFRWTPTLGCWQAYRHPHTLALARRVAGIA